MKKRVILSLTVLSLLLSLLASCGRGGTGEPGTGAEAETSDTEVVTQEEVLPLELVSGGNSCYRVIYPEGADSTLMRAVNALLSVLGGLTGGTYPAGDDYLAAGDEAGETEILIGKTNREASQSAAALLRRGEYTVHAAGKSLVVCGYDTDATVSALEKLSALIRENASDGSFRFRPEDAIVKNGKFYVSSVTIAGVPLGAYRIVVPDAGKAEAYVAVLLRQHLQAYTGYSPEVVTDTTAESDYEIRIGKTNRDSAALPEDGTYTVAVQGTGIQALASSDTGYLGLLNALKQEVFPNTKSEIFLLDGSRWSGADGSMQTPACAGTLRVMYHNTWGYLNADGSNPMANRADLALTVYRRYAPDILCLEEAGSNWEKSADALRVWLAEGYGEIRDTKQNGAGNPIYYKKETVELLESGYSRSRSGDKGTAWGVFREKATGKLFAVTNSHFAANTNAGGDSTLGNTYRTEDAGIVVVVSGQILSAYGQIPIISGGDFNCMAGSDPYTILTNADFINLRTLAKTASDRSPYHGSFSYNREMGIYPLQSQLPYGEEYAIDHIMTRCGKATFHCYGVVSDPLALTSSDHAPHYTDLTLN